MPDDGHLPATPTFFFEKKIFSAATPIKDAFNIILLSSFHRSRLSKNKNNIYYFLGICYELFMY